MKKTIYIADDEENIRDLIKGFLEEAGYSVTIFSNGIDLMKSFEDKQPDLVILDVNMPGTDGFSVCSSIKKKNDKIPVILLTARDTDADYITGFTMGCEDYFTKPFSPVKLSMRVKVILGREKKEHKNEEIKFGDITISPSKKLLFCRENEFHLTNVEFSVLLYLFENKERAVSREEMLEKIWGYDNAVETRVTDDAIKRIRKKLNNQESNVSIETIWGFGFKLVCKEN